MFNWEYLFLHCIQMYFRHNFYFFCLFLSAFKVKLLLPLNAKNYYTKSADIGHMCHADVSKPLNLALSDTYLLYFHLTH